MFSKNKKIKILNCIKLKNFEEDTITLCDIKEDIKPDGKALDLLKNIFIDKGYFIILDKAEIYSYFEKYKDKGIQFLIYISKIKVDIEIFLDFSDFSLDITSELEKKEGLTKDEFKELVSQTGQFVAFELAYVNMLMHEQKVIIEEVTTEKKINVNKSKKKKNKSSKKVKTVKNINITAETIKKINTNKNNTEEKRDYVRQVQSWTVRGYWRTYKSGKKVWIAPQTRKAKNSNSKEKSRKNYIIK